MHVDLVPVGRGKISSFEAIVVPEISQDLSDRPYHPRHQIGLYFCSMSSHHVLVLFHLDNVLSHQQLSK
jgi:hypothetical protein